MHKCKTPEKQEDQWCYFKSSLKPKISKPQEEDKENNNKNKLMRGFLSLIIQQVRGGLDRVVGLSVHLAAQTGSKAGLHWETAGPDTTASMLHLAG